MKKLCIISLVALITLAIFIGCDILFFNHIKKENIEVSNSVEKYLNHKVDLPNYFIKLKPMSQQYEEAKIDFRPVMNPNSKEESIIIFGCSYAYGYVFDNNETISYVMSKYSKRPIYNRAINAWGIQHVIYQLNDKNFYKEIKTKPKYIFYVLMDKSGHFRRLSYTCFPTIIDNNYFLSYKKRGNKLIERKPFLGLYYNFAIFRHIQNKLIDKYADYNFWTKPNKNYFNYFILHFKIINKLIKNAWGGVEKNNQYPQLIILNLEGNQPEYWVDELEKEGIKVIDIADTIGIYNLDNSELGFFEPEITGHPNGKLWEQLIPKLKEMYPDL